MGRRNAGRWVRLKKQRRREMSSCSCDLGLCGKIQQADWQKEKHVPVVECPDKVQAEGWVEVNASLGKAIAHPNTTEHHIRWIKVFFSPDGEKYTYELGRFEFNAHGESAEGANKGPLHTNHAVTFGFKTSKAGTLHAVALCNIHGLWASEKWIEVG
jgi:superoxide reductase